MLLEDILESLKKELVGVKLVVVTKYASICDIEKLYHLGYRDFGENRIERFLEKESYFWNKGLKDIKWHFIGRLQSNKIGRLFSLRGPSSIESIDSLKVLKRVINKVNDLNSRIDLFFQVNTSEEEQKGGFKNWPALQEAYNVFKRERTKKIHLKGLMAMGQKDENGESFRKLRDFRDRLDSSLKLSMGMSRDYKKALEYGTDCVRIGSLIFTETYRPSVNNS